MFRYFIEIAYDGSAYHGWQIQTNAHSVQAALDHALQILLGPVGSTGCGRTDTGVHAAQFYAHFETATAITDTERIVFQLNAILPDDITVFRIIPVDAKAHARFDAVKRSYGYYISRRKPVFQKSNSWYHHKDLDVDAMNEAASAFLYHKDYGCFSKTGSAKGHSICTITHAEWKQFDTALKFSVTANRFLRGMVRAMTGTLLQVGRNEINYKQFIEILQCGDRTKAGPSVPAHGLFLEEIQYNYLHGVRRNPFEL